MKWYHILIIAVLLVYIGVCFYPITGGFEDTKPEEAKKEQLKERMALTDTLAIHLKVKTDTLVTKKDSNWNQYKREVKPKFRVLPADSSIELLKANLEEYHRIKDSL